MPRAAARGCDDRGRQGKTRHSKMRPLSARRGPSLGEEQQSVSLRGRGPIFPCLARPWTLARRVAGVALALLMVGMAALPARAAVHPVIPRPGCEQAPPGGPAQARRLPPECRGPEAGARPAPRHLPGRQQQRMRRCNAQARWHQLRGEQRQEFLRRCLHRGD